MKVIKNLISSVLIMTCFTGCFGEVKRIKVYKNRAEFEKFILQSLEEQYGMEFVVEKYVTGRDPLFHFERGYSGFTGNVRPASSSSGNENVLHRYYTVCNSAGDFATHAHVSMFEKQLRADVEKILKDNGIKYTFLEFQGMSRNLSKWSKDSTYEDYKASKDYESWIHIKLPQQNPAVKKINRKDYAKIILPVVKEIYKVLEPEYNPTVVFYVDKYEKKVYSKEKNEEPVYKTIKNGMLVCLDLSKYNNYLEWTERDIELEIDPYPSEIEWLELLELDD